MSEYVPPELQRVLDRLENFAGDHRTRLARARQAIEPEPEPGPDPEELRRLAEADDAPAELKAVADAVHSGRTTWAQCATGRADHLPELQALYAAARRRLREALESAGRTDDAATAPVAPRTWTDDHGDEFMVRQILRRE